MKSPNAVALGKAGGTAGRGKAKARTSEQARAAAQARWAKQREVVCYTVQTRELYSRDKWTSMGSNWPTLKDAETQAHRLANEAMVEAQVCALVVVSDLPNVKVSRCP